jgi:hypothetical protein
LLRCTAWGVALVIVDSPWRELGGVLDERQRWLERVALGLALVAGWTIGLRPAEQGRTRWLAPAAAVALAMLVLEVGRSRAWILLLLVGWVAYCAGLDLAERAWPFLREPTDDDDDDDGGEERG